MTRKTETDTADVISRLADTGENAVRNLIAFPLRMLLGALDIVETHVHKATDTLREIERVVESERPVDSAEKHTAHRRQTSRTTSEARQRAPTAVSADPGGLEHSTGRRQDPPGSDTSAGHGEA
jgi:hypothetical protein